MRGDRLAQQRSHLCRSTTHGYIVSAYSRCLRAKQGLCIGRVSVRPSFCPVDRQQHGWFAAERGRLQQISIDAQDDSDVISMPAAFRLHLVGKTVISIFHCDIAEIRFVGELIDMLAIIQTYS